MKIKKLAAFLAAVTILTMVSSVVCPIYAATLSDKRGDLTIVAEYDGEGLPGVAVEIFLIATAEINDATGQLEYTATEIFAEALRDENYDPNGMTASENLVITEKLKAYVSEKSLSGTMLSTNGAGTLEFKNLFPGVYMVAQGTSTEANNLGYVMQSFIIPVPYPEESGLLNYIVTAAPKMEPRKGALTLTKAVVGGTADGIGFWFTVKFTYPEKAVRDGVTLNGIKIEEQLSLRLTAGETASFANIPVGTEYEITEVNLPADYELVSITGGGKGTINGSAEITALTATNRYNPPPPPPTTQPSTQPSTQPPTTQPTTQPITLWPTTQPTSQQPTTGPATDSTQPTTGPATDSTQPEATTGPAPTTQPTIGETLGDEDEEYEDVDGTVPLGNFELTEEEEKSSEETEEEEYEDVEETLPLGNLEFEDDEPRDNPKTGDNSILLLLALVLVSGTAAVLIIKKKNSKI